MKSTVRQAIYTSITVSLLAVATPSLAEFHRCEDANGSVSYSDQPCKSDKGASQVKTKQRLTESAIRAMVSSVQRASNTKNVNAMMNHFTRDARFTTRGFSEGNGTFTLAQYKQQLKAAWSLPVNYKTKSKVVSIDIDPSGMSAVVQSTITDTVEADGTLLLEQKSNQTTTIVATAGKPKIQKAVAVAF